MPESDGRCLPGAPGDRFVMSEKQSGAHAGAPSVRRIIGNIGKSYRLYPSACFLTPPLRDNHVSQKVVVPRDVFFE
jgi:hypothetical protein